MNDPDIRKLLIPHLVKQFPEGRIIQEACTGRCIIDLLLVDSCLHGYEIKSDVDNLLRLPAQSKEYSETCRYLTLVAGEKHISEAMKIVPEWWGITLVKNGLVTVREPRENPQADPLALGFLMWRINLFQALEKRGLEKGLRYATKPKLLQKLIDNFTVAEIESEVCRVLKRRRYIDKGTEVIDCWSIPDTATHATASTPNASVISASENDCFIHSGLTVSTGR